MAAPGGAVGLAEGLLLLVATVGANRCSDWRHARITLSFSMRVRSARVAATWLPACGRTPLVSAPLRHLVAATSSPPPRRRHLVAATWQKARLALGRSHLS
eukprot:7409656-Pyramimonas_sp.AAC.1